MDSPNTYPESPMDQEDLVYPCKGCGEILEEGKAFELAGNRWHIDCFRCNTCGTLLDSDANLLLLGDGSLICNNCTYSCSACHNKIEDLAILTGDQAFCSGCFRCRNCKRKIENLRYARTSQGIFCMSCHESLMARRRKKGRTPKTTPGATSGAEKALPSLPPGAAPDSAFVPDGEVPPDMHSDPASRTSRERQPGSRNGNTATNYRQDASPLSEDVRKDGPILPASTYHDTRYTTAGVSSSQIDDDESGGDIPMVLDPTPVASPPVPQAASVTRKPVGRSHELSPSQQKENQPPRDYFGTNGRAAPKTSARSQGQVNRDALREDDRSRSVSTEREQERIAAQNRPSPHILSQDKGRNKKRDTSGANTPVNGSSTTPPAIGGAQDRVPSKLKAAPLATDAQSLNKQDNFKLQDVPKSAKERSRAGSQQGAFSPRPVSPIDARGNDEVGHKPASPVSLDSQNSGVNPFDDPNLKRSRAPMPTTNETTIPPRNADRMLPLRGDSLAAAAHKSKTGTPDAGTPTGSTVTTLMQSQDSSHERNPSMSSVPSTFTDAQSTLSRDNSSRSKVEQQDAHSSIDAVVPPPRAASRPSAPSKSVANDDFIAPRHAPPPPPSGHKQHDSISTMQSTDRPSIDGQLSPVPHSAGLPKYSLDGGFSMDDDLGRILRGEHSLDRNGPASPSVLRRVSNAVKHGRSFSDRAVPGGKSPRNASLDISSPSHTPHITSPTSADGLDTLRTSLRRAQVHIAELEAEKLNLQEKLDGSTDMRAVNTELREKRSTMAFLDTQREMVVRELEIMTEHLSKAKDTSQPMDLASMKTTILKDFAESLQNLKDSMGSQIEDLMHKRNELTDEIGNLIQMKDKGFQEYESLSSKNSQLLQHNNELIRSIQGMYQDNKQLNGGAGATNGLGIYHPAARLDTPGSAEVRSLNIINMDPSMPSLLHDPEAEPASMLTQPQVVNIRKGGKPTKFNWRKGGEKVAGKVSKGLKGALGGDRAPNQGPYAIGHPYDSRQAIAGSDVSSITSKALSDDSKAAGYGFFSHKNGGPKQGSGLGHPKNNSSTNLVSPTDGSVLFGSELSARCEFEGSMLPSIVLRCIAEVEKRGMEMEGIYRKSGGAGQVKAVQQGFEKDNDFDVTDEDLDIHAITSALKQYFRKLPTPLIVYESYEALLEAGQIQDKEQRAAALRTAVNDLPEAHRDCLSYLVGHLARVMAHESYNLMTPLNLAVVFAPTIMRPLSIEREMSDMQIQRNAVQALLENHKAIFTVDD